VRLALRLDPQATAPHPSLGAAQLLIEHYTSPGDLILTENKNLAAEARRLRRLADTHTGAHSTQDRVVRRLPTKPAQLAIVEVETDNAADLLEQTADAAHRLAKGGFLALAVHPTRKARLGKLVRATQQLGLHYWQHIVLVDPLCLHQPDDQSRGARGRRNIHRAHADLLIFRKPAAANAAAASGAIWARVVAA
jgi:hypothetical protein